MASWRRFGKLFAIPCALLALIVLLGYAGFVKRDTFRDVFTLPNWSTIEGWKSFVFIPDTSQGVGDDKTLSRESLPTVADNAVTTRSLALCNATPPGLVGRISVEKRNALSWEKLNSLYPEVSPGGRWRPKHCTSRHHVAIVIPYRNRDEHLRLFLRHMHPFLMKQELDYGIYVVEQNKNTTFNRGMLQNIGFVEALKSEKYECFVFSDVDLLPEDDRNLYDCPERPRHMAVGVSTRNYRLFYKTAFGGVVGFKTEHFRLINGFSNQYFGWGSEDDDLFLRVKNKSMTITRPPIEIARYTMLRHVKEKPNPLRWNIMNLWKKRQMTDGLSSLAYDVIKHEQRPLYTLISVVIDEKAVKRQLSKVWKV